MLGIVLVFVLIWFVLMGFLFAWTFWFQGYIYTEPAGQLYWRAPAAGTALTVFLIVWIAIDYHAVKNNADARFPYGPLQELAPATTAVEPFQALFVPSLSGENEVEYSLTKTTDGRKVHLEYRHGQDPMPSRPLKVIVVENGVKSVFEPDHDAKGQFKSERGQSLFYRDSKGRVLREGTFERIPSYRFGPFLLGILLNITFLACWFICLWLLLRYQMWHAFGLAVVFYAIALFVLVPVMSRTEAVARPQPVVQPTE